MKKKNFKLHFFIIIIQNLNHLKKNCEKKPDIFKKTTRDFREFKFSYILFT